MWIHAVDSTHAEETEVLGAALVAAWWPTGCSSWFLCGHASCDTPLMKSFH